MEPAERKEVKIVKAEYITEAESILILIESGVRFQIIKSDYPCFHGMSKDQSDKEMQDLADEWNKWSGKTIPINFFSGCDE